MHLAEFALRDFMNVEKLARWTGAIVFDDILPDASPRSPPATAARAPGRATSTSCSRSSRRQRPDLICLRVGTQPTGLLLVLGLDPASRVLRKGYDEIATEIVTPDPQDVPVDVLERDGVADPERVLAAPFWAKLREARAKGTQREAGIEPLRTAVRRDVEGVSGGRLRRLLPV